MSKFLEFSAELWTSPVEKHKAAAKDLFLDWETAKGKILTEMTAKLAHFSQLPWKLLGLAHHDRHKAAHAAQECLALWKQGGVQCRHRQCQRFLNPDYPESDSDPALRSLVDRMATGESIEGPDFVPLRRWLCRFQTIRLAERTVEGTHAVVTRSLKRAPAASLGYLSIELRFRSFWQELSKDPSVT